LKHGSASFGVKRPFATTQFEPESEKLAEKKHFSKLWSSKRASMTVAINSPYLQITTLEEEEEKNC
jgi:hypothetical protein